MLNPHSMEPNKKSLNGDFKRMLQNLRRGPPSLAEINSILSPLLRQPETFDWTSDIVLEFTISLIRTFDPLLRHLSEEENVKFPDAVQALLLLWTTAMESWTDPMMYTAISHEEKDCRNSNSALSILKQLISSKDTRTKRTAMVGLSTTYRALDRLDSLASLDIHQPDVAWWLDLETTKLEIIPFSIELLIR